MWPTHTQPFQPLLNSSGPAFNSSAMGATSYGYKIEGSTAGLRDWQGPGSRTVRLLGVPNVPYYVNFGASAVISETSNSVLCLGSEPAFFTVDPKQTYLALVSSTTVTVNVTLGVGR